MTANDELTLNHGSEEEALQGRLWNQFREQMVQEAPARRERHTLLLAALDQWRADHGAAASFKQYEVVGKFCETLRFTISQATADMGEKTEYQVWLERNHAEQRGEPVPPREPTSLDEAKFWQTVFGESRSSRIKLARSAFRFDASTADLSDDEILARYDANPDWYSQ